MLLRASDTWPRSDQLIPGLLPPSPGWLSSDTASYADEGKAKPYEDKLVVGGGCHGCQDSAGFQQLARYLGTTPWPSRAAPSLDPSD